LKEKNQGKEKLDEVLNSQKDNFFFFFNTIFKNIEGINLLI